MITLTLLHPVQATPVQQWTFDQGPVIRVGRGADNHIVLYSAVVSRHHLELHQRGEQWELKNLGANGTYLNSQRVHQAIVANGSLMRLARSGPILQIRLASTAGVEEAAEKNAVPSQLLSTSPEGQEIEEERLFVAQSALVDSLPEVGANLQPEVAAPPLEPATVDQEQSPSAPCPHWRSQPGDRFCIDCGSSLGANPNPQFKNPGPEK